VKEAGGLLTGFLKGSRTCLLSMWQKLAGVEQFTTTQLQSNSWWTSKSPLNSFVEQSRPTKEKNNFDTEYWI
jgi:hypothetical protein